MKKSGWPTTSRQSRGYDSEWEKVRRIVLARDNGLCQCKECKAPGVLPKLGNEVHHIISRDEGKRKGWDRSKIDDPSNLASINHDCHKRETAAEQGRTLKAKRVIGSDGWPAEVKR